MTVETEAESVAYVLAAMSGLDNSAYGVGYIATWTGGDLDIVRDTAASVLRAVHALATALEPTDDADEAGDEASKPLLAPPSSHLREGTTPTR